MRTLTMPSYVGLLERRRPGLRALTGVLALGTAVWLAACVRILTQGLSTLGIDTYGATWGILVVNTVHLIGISHVGIAVSATVRVLRLDRYRAVARMGEVITLIALALAVVNLFLHVGRPDRFVVNVLLYGRWHSPMVWSMTVFVLYYLSSLTYLYLSLRRDLWFLGDAPISPSKRRLYRLLSAGYRDTPLSRERHRRALHWMAVLLVPVMLSVHSVYGLLFGMISARAGWYNPLQAPYFVLGAVVSGFSAILVVAALLRWGFGWEEHLTDRIFRTFGAFLAFVTSLYLYFMVSEQLTGQYLPLAAEGAVSDALLRGAFAPAFWLTTLVGLVLPLCYLLLQSLGRSTVHVGMTAAAAAAVNVALWVKRYLVVVPGQYQSALEAARPAASYVPTVTEWLAVLGSYAAGALAFVLLLGFIPLFELPFPTHESDGAEEPGDGARRRALMVMGLLAGTGFIAWGIAQRAGDLVPARWIAGILLLLSVPLVYCLVDDATPVTGTEEADT